MHDNTMQNRQSTRRGALRLEHDRLVTIEEGRNHDPGMEDLSFPSSQNNHTDPSEQQTPLMNDRNPKNTHSSLPSALRRRRMGVSMPVDQRKEIANPMAQGTTMSFTTGFSRFMDGVGAKQSQPMIKRRLLSVDTSDSVESFDPLNKRYISKNHGHLHINYRNVPVLKSRIIQDSYHTIVDATWVIFGSVFAFSFIASWVGFALLWWGLVSYRDGCVDNVNSFATAFLYSVETQVTVGYGGRALTDLCDEATILICAQSIVGAFINCVMLGVLFAKLARPQNRSRSIRFTEHAVVTLRDGKYCFMFRYMDSSSKKLLATNIRLLLLRPRLTKEGQYWPLDITNLEITIDYHQVEYSLALFPIYPVSIVHVIDSGSPLYDITKMNLFDSQMEIVAVVEGAVPGTGNTTQAVTSYTPTEILWGHRFQPVFYRCKEGESKYIIDLEPFNGTVREMITPTCSARQHDREQKEEKERSERDGDDVMSEETEEELTNINDMKKAQGEEEEEEEEDKEGVRSRLIGGGN